MTASYGVNGFTDDHREALKGKHVLIAYDRDEAGDQAAEQLKKELIQFAPACCFRMAWTPTSTR